MFFSLPWHIPKSEHIKLKSCRNLIEHYLGNFLEKLTLEQLSVNLYNGTGTVSDVTLDCDALNKLGDERNWPLQVVNGHMQDITVKVPWSNVFKDDSILKVDGLSLTLQPKIRTEPVKSFLMWMVINWPKLSSKQLFSLNKQTNGFQRHVEQEEKMFANSIEAILKRLKLKLENTKIRIEHLPKHINRGFAMEFYIKSIDCYDEAEPDFTPRGTDLELSKTCLLDTYTKKKIKIEGVTLYTDEFHVNRNSLKNRYDNLQAPQRFKIDCDLNNNIKDCVFHEMKNDILRMKQDTVKDVNLTFNSIDDVDTEKSNPLGPIMFAILKGQQELTLSVNKSGKMEGVSIAAETTGPLEIVLSQKQLDAVIDLLTCLKTTRSQKTRKISDGLDILNNILCCVD
ncbi:unnamed protein product [Arctia plantaginis]|uniref:Autophagy-related protein 2 n=1 Tax=Arctia plantaginis TaxID=874455 RepID=A0A8S1ALL9_ARCPL|nr:unnamed protein product [Arctia plantaginis]